MLHTGNCPLHYKHHITYQQCRPGFTPELAPEPWYGAEGALVVAALSHPQVSCVSGCEAVSVPLGPERHCG